MENTLNLFIYGGRSLRKLLGAPVYDAILDIVLIVCLILYIQRGYYRETWLYKRIMGDKAKPCLYDGRGNRIRNPDGTPIESQEENAEPEAPKEGETPAGEQEEKTKQ